MKKGQKLYRLAKKVILGGNMLFSKRPELIAHSIDQAISGFP